MVEDYPNDDTRLEKSFSYDKLFAFNSRVDEFPIKIEDENGVVSIYDYIISGNKIKLYLTEICNGNTYVSGITGSDPANIIIDYATQIHVLCFYKFLVTRG